MIPAVIILFLVAVNAFYVMAEYAMVGVGRLRAQRLVRERRSGARLVLSLVSDVRRLDRAITACQIGISASSMALGAYSQMVLAPALMPALGRLGWGTAAVAGSAVALTLLGTTALQVVLGEQVPKSMAVRNPPRWSLLTAAPLAISMAAFTPFIFLLSGTADFVLKLFRLPALRERSLHSATEIGWMVSQSAQAGKLGGDLRDRLQNALRLARRRAQDIMVPRVEVVSVAETTPLDEVQRLLQDTGYTRLPVYRDTPDAVIGIVHAKDLLLRRTGDQPARTLGELLRPVILVAFSTRALDVLETMREKRANLAVVVDERGGTAGIITMEDLVERVLGEIDDEFDATRPRLGLLDDGRLRLPADENIDDANARHGLDLKAEEARTLGGLVMEHLDRVAEPGDAVNVGGWRIEVEQVRARRIETVLVGRLGRVAADERR